MASASLKKEDVFGSKSFQAMWSMALMLLEELNYQS